LCYFVLSLARLCGKTLNYKGAQSLHEGRLMQFQKKKLSQNCDSFMIDRGWNLFLKILLKLEINGQVELYADRHTPLFSGNPSRHGFNDADCLIITTGSDSPEDFNIRD